MTKQLSKNPIYCPQYYIVFIHSKIATRRSGTLTIRSDQMTSIGLRPLNPYDHPTLVTHKRTPLACASYTVLHIYIFILLSTHIMRSLAFIFIFIFLFIFIFTINFRCQLQYTLRALYFTKI